MIPFFIFLFITASSAWEVTWLYPQHNRTTFNVIDTIYLSWTSNTKHTSMNLWCLNSHSDYWEPPFPHTMMWDVPSSGSYALKINHLPPTYTKCHIGFYPQAAAIETVSSIGDSPNFFVIFDRHTTRKTWGKRVADNLKASLKQNGKPNSDGKPKHTPSKEPSQSPALKPTDLYNSSGGLSVGAKVGIAIGVVVGVVAVAALVGYMVLRRRRARKPHELPAGESHNEQPYSGQTTQVTSPQPTSMQHVYIHEATGDTKFMPSELDGTARSEISA